MVKTIIEAYPKKERIPRKDGSIVLYISECFMDTVQGENFTGYPATFIRTMGCVLNCKWCDSKEVWRKGNPYSVLELLELFEKHGTIDKLRNGQHLVLTGGSPLLQQCELITFITEIIKRYNFKPFIEIENECVCLPNRRLLKYVNVWNNSPKLKNCGLKFEQYHKPEIIKGMSQLKNSWFKFVISNKCDWDEIEGMFLKPKLIKKPQIVLMPEGATQQEIKQKYNMVVDMAVKHSVRMTDRLHITIWNKKIGV